LVKIKLGKQDKLYLGNLDARKDWGYAKDYVEGMWLMMQAKNPGDYILSTNKTHSVREFVEESAKILGIDIKWIDKGINEKGIDNKTGKSIIEIDSKFFRPVETNTLIGDNSKAKKDFGWKPKTSFKELIKLMTKADLKTGLEK
jgi:GDPmannose 4,6-dehydratase